MAPLQRFEKLKFREVNQIIQPVMFVFGKGLRPNLHLKPDFSHRTGSQSSVKKRIQEPQFHRDSISLTVSQYMLGQTKAQVLLLK